MKSRLAPTKPGSNGVAIAAAPANLREDPPAQIEKKTRRLLASGIAGQFVTKEPLVALRASGDFYNNFDVCIHMFLPDHALNVDLSEDISTINPVDIEDGSITVREFNILYDTPPVTPEMYCYSLWEIRLRYCVNGEQAQAIRVRYIIDDPETTHGTVTSVEKT